MSNGKRYDNEPKLNKKKVVGVFVAIAVMAMLIISIKTLLSPKKEENLVASTNYVVAYQNGKWGVINQAGTEVIPFTYEEMIIIPDKTKDVFITMTDIDINEGSFKTKVFNKKQEQIFTEYETVEGV